MKKTTLPTIALLSFVTSACTLSPTSAIPNEVSPEDSGKITNLDERRVVSDLTDSERSTYCDNQRAYMARKVGKAEMHRVLCERLGALSVPVPAPKVDAEIQSKCRAGADKCMSETTGYDTTCSFSAADKLRQCSATIAEYNGCYEEKVAAHKRWAEQGYCSTLRALKPGETYQLPPLPPSCEAIRSKCPNAAEVD
ncbi:MAG: hypothetical protein JNL38_35060 [Myxococcales bacterium]|nr:hypothetical protein [Myxococcales bacterium]